MPYADPEQRREHQRAYMAAWRAANPERAREQSRRSEANRNKEATLAKNREWYERHRDEVLERRREVYAADPESVRTQNRHWRETNPEWGRAYAKQFRQSNPDYDRNRRLDPQIKISDVWHARLTRAVASVANRKRLPVKWRSDSILAPVLGCSPLELRAYFEARFPLGMTWENRGSGGWEVDLIRPCTAFDLTDERQLGQCFHYTNLQPLWRADNQRKYNKRS